MIAITIAKSTYGKVFPTKAFFLDFFQDGIGYMINFKQDVLPLSRSCAFVVCTLPYGRALSTSASAVVLVLVLRTRLIVVLIVLIVVLIVLIVVRRVILILILIIVLIVLLTVIVLHNSSSFFVILGYNKSMLIFNRVYTPHCFDSGIGSARSILAKT